MDSSGKCGWCNPALRGGLLPGKRLKKRLKYEIRKHRFVTIF
jgi:hypothetical protein